MSSLNELGQDAAAKKKSYQLIVHLDGALEPNNLKSFKVIVYNSDHKKIISDDVTPDFSASHQKLSSDSGYKISDKSKQYPSEIQVCVQQDYSVDGKPKIHDDCFTVNQNKDKNNWYSTFDYVTIEGFEGDESK